MDTKAVNETMEAVKTSKLEVLQAEVNKRKLLIEVYQMERDQKVDTFQAEREKVLKNFEKGFKEFFADSFEKHNIVLERGRQIDLSVSHYNLGKEDEGVIYYKRYHGTIKLVLGNEVFNLLDIKFERESFSDNKETINFNISAGFNEVFYLASEVFGVASELADVLANKRPTIENFIYRAFNTESLEAYTKSARELGVLNNKIRTTQNQISNLKTEYTLSNFYEEGIEFETGQRYTFKEVDGSVWFDSLKVVEVSKTGKTCTIELGNSSFNNSRQCNRVSTKIVEDFVKYRAEKSKNLNLNNLEE